MNTRIPPILRRAAPPKPPQKRRRGMPETFTPPTCEVCGKQEAVGVCAVPGVPYSAAYCRECLSADSHPMNILIANTACLGGLGHAAAWWKEMVERSLHHQGKTLEWFNLEVERALKEG